MDHEHPGGWLQIVDPSARHGLDLAWLAIGGGLLAFWAGVTAVVAAFL
jgi:hypothetical protein